MNCTNNESDRCSEQVNQQEVYDMWVKCTRLWKKWAYKMSYVDYEREDWEQHSYIVCCRAVQTYKSAAGISFTAYYRMILYREGRKIMSKGHDYLAYEDEIEEYRLENEMLLEELVFKQEQIRRLQEGINSLDASQQEVISRFYLLEQSMKDTAPTMGLTYKMVEYKKSRALKQLKKFLEKV